VEELLESSSQLKETKLQTERADVWLPRRRDGRGGMDWESETSSDKLK